MESKIPRARVTVGLVLSCLPFAAVAGLASDSSAAELVRLDNPFLLISVALLLPTVALIWVCMRLKQQNMRNQSSALSALGAMREMVEALQENEAALRHQLIEQTAELAQLKTHPGQLTLRPSVVAPARSSAQR